MDTSLSPQLCAQCPLVRFGAPVGRHKRQRYTSPAQLQISTVQICMLLLLVPADNAIAPHSFLQQDRWRLVALFEPQQVVQLFKPPLPALFGTPTNREWTLSTVI